MKPSVKISLGILTSLATIGFIFVYDHFKEQIDSVEVVTVKPGAEILRSDTITRDKLQIVGRSRDTLVDGTIMGNQINSIIGLDANYNLIGNEIVAKDMVDLDGMVPNVKKNEAIRPITKDMIYAEPGSLRRKDRIDIYVLNATQLSSNGSQTIQTTSTSSNHMIDGIQPILRNVRVDYVKDANNKEVTSPQDSKNTNKRLDATSNISDLEVILNESDFQKLMNAVIDNNMKLYITYH